MKLPFIGLEVRRIVKAKPAKERAKYTKKVGRCGCKLTPDNVIVLGNGTRRCRKHYLAYHKAYNAKKRLERAAKGGQK
jgi:hypothetical protein